MQVEIITVSGSVSKDSKIPDLVLMQANYFPRCLPIGSRQKWVPKYQVDVNGGLCPPGIGRRESIPHTETRFGGRGNKRTREEFGKEIPNRAQGIAKRSESIREDMEDIRYLVGFPRIKGLGIDESLPKIHN